MPAHTRSRPARVVPTPAETRRLALLVAVVATAAVGAVLTASHSDAAPMTPTTVPCPVSVPAPLGEDDGVTSAAPVGYGGPGVTR